MSEKKKRLLRWFAAMTPEGQEQLLAFAEFLAERHAARAPRELPEPRGVPRPHEESVVGAIKRLSHNYHMLEKERLLHESSRLMSEHLLQGRHAREVIDELEAIFERHYHQARAAHAAEAGVGEE